MRIDRKILRSLFTIAGPLTLAMTGSLMMQMADTLFLAWYSSDALAAVGPAGISCWVYGSLFHGMATYTTPLVAQCVGRGQRRRVGMILWQGVYLALVFGLLLLAASPYVARVFEVFDHAAPIQAMERSYFRILCVGIPAGMLTAVLGGFYGGRGDTRPLMIVQLAGVLINIVLDYAMIFGRWGFPRWGIAGAAWATVVSQIFTAAALFALVLGKRWRREFKTHFYGFHPASLKLFLRFGLPSGFRMFTESCAWLMFVFFVGRVDAASLAATNIANRLNHMAFFPIWGLAEAVRALVGQAQGRGDPDESVRVVWHGMAVTQIWMITMAVIYVAAPRTLYGLFAPAAPDPAAVTDFAEIARIGAVLMRYVAAYCLLDAFNIVLVMALQAAGDTRWSMRMSLLAHAILVLALWVGDMCLRSFHVPWSIATVFIMSLALMWIYRFRSGVWRGIDVIS